MDSRGGLVVCLFLTASILLCSPACDHARAQGAPPSPYHPPSVIRTDGLDLGPSNPLRLPGTTGGLQRGSDSVYLSGGMFHDIIPLIPNLEIGYLYNFGQKVSTDRLTLDYVCPVGLGTEGALFGEAHGEFTNFWKTVQRFVRNGDTTTNLSGVNDRIDLSFGGGYRRLINQNLLLGANGFYDMANLGGRWYGSGGLGLEMAALLPGSDMMDLNFNYYGNVFQGPNGIVNAFRSGTGNFDIEAGYSHELFDNGPDLRLKLTGYQFDIGTKVYGSRAGAELKTRDGILTMRYEAAHDRVNGTYHTVGASVNVGFQPEMLLSGGNPFTMPAPIFKSPRNLTRLLMRPAKRNYSQASAAVIRQRASGPSGDVWFRVDCQGQVGGSFTGLPAIGNAATWDMPDSYATYTTYSINFEGNTGGLPPTVPVTVTWSNTFRNSGFRWGPGDDSYGSFTRNVPRTGGTVGNGGSVVDTNPDNRPEVQNDKDGVQGTVTFEAPGVTTLTITVSGPSH